MRLIEINPFIRYVNNYAPTYSYVEIERIIYDYEFMYIMSGSAIMNYDGIKYALKKGDLFYLKPLVKNNIIVDGKSNFRTHCIHFDYFSQDKKYDFTAEEFYMHSVLSENYREKELFLQNRPTPEPLDFVIPAHMENLPYETFASLFEKCYREFAIGTTPALLRAKSVFTDIIATLYQIITNATYTNNAHPRILNAIEYIKENYNEHITVAELSKKYELSPKYFGKLFRLATGKSINAFILEKRIFAAKEMLLGTDAAIDEIASKIGFSDAFYFSKCFKISEGLSPTNYRFVMKK